MAEFTNKLVKEAIADAEAVRESAIANAKLALEETFTPAIKQLIAKRLKDEATADEKLEREMQRAIASNGNALAGQDPNSFAAAPGQQQDELDTSAIGTGVNKEPDEFTTSGIGDSAPSNIGQEFTGSDLEKEGPGPQKLEAVPPSNDDLAAGAGLDGLEDMGDEEGEEGDEDYDEFDLDLESIIKELEADIEALKNAQAEKSGGSEEEEEEEEEGEEDLKKAAPAPPFGVEKEETVVESVPNTTSGLGSGGDNKQPEGFTSSGIGSSTPDNVGKEFKGSDLEKKGSAETKYEGEENAAPAPDYKKASSADTETTHSGQNFVKEGSEEDLDLHEILDELEVSNYEQMASEIASLQTENTELRKAVKFIRGKLNEVNLLNAKLLFTNKLFRISGLTNEQKVRIVENIDRTTTVREVKLVYTALAENISGTPRKVPSRKKVTVMEGTASKATASSTAPKQEIITEASTSAKRLQVLAGILKDEN
jgi:hypothetical protein